MKSFEDLIERDSKKGRDDEEVQREVKEAGDNFALEKEVKLSVGTLNSLNQRRVLLGPLIKHRVWEFKSKLFETFTVKEMYAHWNKFLLRDLLDADEDGDEKILYSQTETALQRPGHNTTASPVSADFVGYDNNLFQVLELLFYTPDEDSQNIELLIKVLNSPVKWKYLSDREIINTFTDKFLLEYYSIFELPNYLGRILVSRLFVGALENEAGKMLSELDHLGRAIKRSKLLPDFKQDSERGTAVLAVTFSSVLKLQTLNLPEFSNIYGFDSLLSFVLLDSLNSLAANLKESTPISVKNLLVIAAYTQSLEVFKGIYDLFSGAYYFSPQASNQVKEIVGKVTPTSPECKIILHLSPIGAAAFVRNAEIVRFIMDRTAWNDNEKSAMEAYLKLNFGVIL